MSTTNSSPIDGLAVSKNTDSTEASAPNAYAPAAASSPGAAAASSTARVDLMTTTKKEKQPSKVKFSQLLTDKKVIQCLTKFHPLMWLKLKMCSRIMQWRLLDEQFSAMLPYLNEELGLTRPDLNLHELAEQGDVDSIWLLVLQGVPVRQKCQYTQATLLQKSIHSKNLSLIHMLLSKGAGPNVKGVYGYTALHECAYMGTGRICQLLLDYKANVDAISKNGSTPLLVAAREGNVDIVTILLANGAHPDDGGDKGWGPLYMAAGEGHIDTVQTLLHYQANPGEQSHSDQLLPIQEALKNKHFEVVALLQNHMLRHGMPIPIEGADVAGASVVGALAAAQGGGLDPRVVQGGASMPSAGAVLQNFVLQLQHAQHNISALEQKKAAVAAQSLQKPNDPELHAAMEQIDMHLDHYRSAAYELQAQIQQATAMEGGVGEVFLAPPDAVMMDAAAMEAAHGTMAGVDFHAPMTAEEEAMEEVAA